ncbi:MAG: peptidyl-prolyl cis-trans isomerase [Acidobacteriota bacterium]|nr:MAG: peptidyl-prolyl cis-trans isomerase [Acidobacteriota bacterium]
MLNVLRENLRYTKWILVAVALSFALFFGVDWWAPSGGRGGIPWIAEVNGREIPVGVWQVQARRLEDQYRRMFGAQFEQMRGQLDLARSAAEGLIQKELIVQDAERLGLNVTDEELAAEILELPIFQQDGAFVGMAQYETMLRRGFIQPYRTSDQFEQAMREDLLQGKWRALLEAAVVVTPDEIEREFMRRNESVTLDYVALPLADFESEIEPSDSELKSWFEARRDEYSQGEARRASYVLFDDRTVADKVEITDEDILAYYDEHQDVFTRPEQRRARHILIRVAPDAGDAQIDLARGKAEELLARARGGADFGQLAAQVSEDEASREQGGDLGFFSRGRMVPPFEEAVFSLEPGELSDVVRTTFGFHVIKLEQVREPGVQSLDEVREQIRAQLRFPRLREAQRELASALKANLGEASSLTSAASEMGLEVRDTGMVTRSGTVPGLGPVPEMVSTMFSLQVDQPSEVLSLPSGEVVLVVEQIAENYLPPLDSVRARVLADFRSQKAAQAASETLGRALERADGDLSKAAKRLATKLRSTEPPLRRGQTLDQVGVDSLIEREAFSAEPGVVVGPMVGEQAVVALQVTDREEPDPSQLEQQYAAIEQQLKAPRLEQLYQQRMESLAEEAQISRNPALFDSKS